MVEYCVRYIVVDGCRSTTAIRAVRRQIDTQTKKHGFTSHLLLQKQFSIQ